MYVWLFLGGSLGDLEVDKMAGEYVGRVQKKEKSARKFVSLFVFKTPL